MRGLDFDYMLGLLPVLLGYVPLTLFMAFVGMVCALVLASVLAVERVFRRSEEHTSELQSPD